jgi:hypothetical protein
MRFQTLVLKSVGSRFGTGNPISFDPPIARNSNKQAEQATTIQRAMYLPSPKTNFELRTGFTKKIPMFKCIVHEMHFLFRCKQRGSHGQPRLALPRKVIVDVELSYRRGCLIGLVDIHFPDSAGVLVRSINPRDPWPRITLAIVLVIFPCLGLSMRAPNILLYTKNT